jgi:hypothetical protein
MMLLEWVAARSGIAQAGQALALAPLLLAAESVVPCLPGVA